MAQLMQNDYFRLFVKREGKVVLGNKCSNLWIMTAVLFVAFLALAFSNASLNYLNYKMEDPFIKWQNIENDHTGRVFNSLVEELKDDNIQKRFHFCGVKEDYKIPLSFYGKDSWGSYPSYCRLYTDMNTELMRTILDTSNVVNRPAYDVSLLHDAVLGVVVTEQMLQVMGYTTVYPPYIDLSYWISTTGEWRSLDFVENSSQMGQGADEEDFDDGGYYAKLPIPVLGVVKRLPGNLPFSASAVLKGNLLSALNLGSAKNISVSNSLLFFVDERIDASELESRLEELCAQYSDLAPIISRPEIPQLMPFAKGVLVEVENAPMMGWEAVKAVSDAVRASYPSDQVVRVFNYPVDRDELALPEYADYLTVEFSDLKKLTAFVDYVSEYTDGEIELDITQTNVKENLNAVQLLANILSMALILFAITCIVLFIVNLLQSYFQQVKRNLGTFKAFGISNKELMSVYLVIILTCVAAALLISLLAVALLQLLTPEREAGFGYLSLWNWQTGVSIVIVLAAAIATVYLVMGKLLKATPGDLIYDRQ